MRRVGRLLGIGLVGQVNAIGFLDDQGVDPSVASIQKAKPGARGRSPYTAGQRHSKPEAADIRGSCSFV